jgi:hypothetical protein
MALPEYLNDDRFALGTIAGKRCTPACKLAPQFIKPMIRVMLEHR